MAERSSTIPRLDPNNLTRDNIVGCYKDLKDFTPNLPLMRKIGRAFAGANKPLRTTANKGSKNILTQRILEGRPVEWVSSHEHEKDQFDFLGAVYDEETLEDGSKEPMFEDEVRNLIIERLRILFKLDYLREEGEAEGSLGLQPDQLIPLGGIPVIRSGDDELSRFATPHLIDTGGQLILDGYNLFAFPEGTRNTDSPESLLELKTGMAKMVFRAIDLGSEEPAIATIGMNRNSDGGVRVHFGEVLTNYTKAGPEALTAKMSTAIQAAVNASRLD